MDEKTFFESGNVKVTNARFIVGSRTYAMSGVTSVKSHVEEPKRGGPIIVGLLGLIITLIGTVTAIVIGLVLIAAAVMMLIGQKPEYSVILSSSSGEVQALSSEDEAHISGVINSLNDVLIHRG